MFLDFSLYAKAGKNMRRPLGEEMDIFMEKYREIDTKQLEIKFKRAIDSCERLWGRYAFYKPTRETWRSQLISPLYDAQMVAVAMLTDEQLSNAIENQGQVIEATKDLFKK